MTLRTLYCALTMLTVCARTQAQKPAPRLPSYDIALPGHAFGNVTTADGAWVFVSLSSDAGAGGIAVVGRSGAGYALNGVVPLALGATGLALTHDGNLLIVAAGDEVYFLDVSHVNTGGADAVSVVGMLSDGAGAGSIWASVTADDHWLFVCDEDTGQITVIDLNRARSTLFSTASVVGTIPLGAEPTSTVFSPDGTLAYTTVLQVSSQLGWPITCTEEGSTSPELVNPQGAIVVFNVAQATANPRLAVTAAGQFVAAGCSPVRQQLSSDALTLYVTARNNNEVLTLDTARFAANPMKAITASAPAGAAPVPLALIDSGSLLIVGNSNRFLDPDASQSLNVFDVAKLQAGAGATALVGSVPAGAFPRALTLSPDGATLFLSNYDSNSLQVMDALRLAATASSPHARQ